MAAQVSSSWSWTFSFCQTASLRLPLKDSRWPKFFGSVHRKSTYNACGGIIKRLVDEDVSASEVGIQNARDTYLDHCSEPYELPASANEEPACWHTKRVFQLIEKKDIESDWSIPSSTIATVFGTWQLHSKLVSKVVLWALSTTKNYIRAGNKCHSISNLFCTKVLKLQNPSKSTKLFSTHIENKTYKLQIQIFHSNCGLGTNMKREWQAGREEVSRPEPEEALPPCNMYFRQLVHETISCMSFMELEEVVQLVS